MSVLTLGRKPKEKSKSRGEGSKYPGSRAAMDGKPVLMFNMENSS